MRWDIPHISVSITLRRTRKTRMALVFRLALEW